MNYDIDECLMIALDHASSQQELTAVLVLIQKQVHRGKVLWKEYFRTRINNNVRRNVKFDRDMEERVQRVQDLLDRDNFTVFSKKLEAFRD